MHVPLLGLTVVAFGFALLVGATLGLFGGGGGVLTVPILVYIVGVPEKSAVPMSLLVIGTASAVGALDRWRTNHLDPSHGVWYGLAAVAGAFVGGKIGILIPARVQLAMFGIAVVLSAISMLRSSGQAERARGNAPLALRAVIFAAIGAFTGIVGVGGGFLFVPALVVLAGFSMIEATSLSLMVIAMNALAGFASYAGQVAIDWRLALSFTICVVLAMLPAGMLARKLPVAALKRGFAVLLIVVGTFVLYRNLA